MVIKTECVICKNLIIRPRIGQITCDKKECKRKYTTILKEAKELKIDLPENA